MKPTPYRAIRWPFFSSVFSLSARWSGLLGLVIVLTACQANDTTPPGRSNAQSQPPASQEPPAMKEKPPEKTGRKICPKDAKLCPDGITSVSRNPDNNCEFYPCPKTDQAQEKPVTDKENPAANSDGPGAKKTFTEQVFCPQDVRQCPDGSWVGRDPNNNCQFRPCPDGSIPGEESPDSPLE